MDVKLARENACIKGIFSQIETDKICSKVTRCNVVDNANSVPWI